MLSASFIRLPPARLILCPSQCICKHIFQETVGRQLWRVVHVCVQECADSGPMPCLVALQGLRAALNAALFRTGDQSRDFAVVLATNRPADLDPAVLDRMDEALEFPLPGPDERARILQIYLDSYIAKAGSDEGAGACPPCPVYRL